MRKRNRKYPDFLNWKRFFFFLSIAPGYLSMFSFSSLIFLFFHHSQKYFHTSLCFFRCSYAFSYDSSEILAQTSWFILGSRIREWGQTVSNVHLEICRQSWHQKRGRRTRKFVFPLSSSGSLFGVVKRLDYLHPGQVIVFSILQFLNIVAIRWKNVLN